MNTNRLTATAVSGFLKSSFIGFSSLMPSIRARPGTADALTMLGEKSIANHR
jgi:hypothetical protein